MAYWYLATPYTQYPGGIEQAYRLACFHTQRLARVGVPVYSPIVYTHPFALEMGIDPLDHAFWMAFDRPMMGAATGLIMLKAPGWEASKGMAEELKTFREAGKPVRWLDLHGRVDLDSFR